jgi:hypothetical protein
MSEHERFGVTQEEWAQMHHMALEIWGADLYLTRNLRHDTTERVANIPVLVGEHGARWVDADTPQPYPSPMATFTQIRVELDHWLLPGRMRAGYDAEHNMIVMSANNAA